MVATVQGISKGLDDVFAFIVAKQGLVSNDDLAGIEERPLAPFLVEQGVISAEQADQILATIGKSVLACMKCGAIYTGLAATDGKKYACKKCKALIAFPNEITIEARTLKFAEKTPSASNLPAVEEKKTPSASAIPAVSEGRKAESNPPAVKEEKRTPSSSANPAVKAVEAPAAPRVEQPAPSKPAVPAEPVKWFFNIDGKKNGPHDDKSIADLVAAEKLDHATLAWRKGMKAWTRAGDVAEFATHLEDVPPPLDYVAAPAASSSAPAPAASQAAPAASAPAAAEKRAPLTTDKQADAKAESKPEAKAEPKAGGASSAPAGETGTEVAAAPVDDKTCEEGKVPAILSYWGLLWVLGFLMKKQNQFARYHNAQGFVFLVFTFLTYGVLYATTFITATLAGFLTFIPAGFWSLYVLVINVYWLLWLFIAIKGTLNVLNKKQEPVPFLNKIPLLGMIVRKIGSHVPNA